MLISQANKALALLNSRSFSTSKSRNLRSFSPKNTKTTNTSPDLLQSAQQVSNDKYKQPMAFQTNHKIEGTAEERMKNVFGGRLAGGERVASSRREVGAPAIIAGVTVPSRPKEPDNCCMSGCVNCVWEQYNDDIKDWRHKRNHAIKAIKDTDEHWPADFDPPLGKLDVKNVPQELRSQKRRLERAKKITTASYFPTIGAPGAQNITRQATSLASEEEDDEWKNVPVSFKVFAQTEKMMKEKRAKRAAELAKKKKAEEEAAKMI